MIKKPAHVTNIQIENLFFDYYYIEIEYKLRQFTFLGNRNIEDYIRLVGFSVYHDMINQNSMYKNFHKIPPFNFFQKNMLNKNIYINGEKVNNFTDKYD